MTTTLITGTTHGIGRVTARELLKAGHTVIMLCRHEAAAYAVRDELLQQVPNGMVQVVTCDLSSLQSVRQAAATVRNQATQLDLLINNAGTVSLQHRFSTDGFELVFATNHLGPFLLTELLRPMIPAGGRIINVASCAHYPATLELSKVIDQRASYSPNGAYRQSKLANVLHTFALARRLRSSGITVTCLHPGVVNTHLLPYIIRVLKPLITPVTFTAERGAQTTLQLALSPDISELHGCYIDEYGQPQTASALANDAGLQEALWAASVEWTAGQSPPGGYTPGTTTQSED